MKIELDEEQQRAVQQGQPVEFIDPATDRAYLVIAREAYERRPGSQDPAPRRALSCEDADGIPAGILRSQQAFWQGLPELLKTKRNHGKWVGYHKDEQIGIAGSKTELIRTIRQRNIGRGEYYLAVIRPREIPPWEPEEVEPLGAHHFED